MHYLDESHILLFLIQLGLILMLARFFGELFRRIKQPVLTAELLIGIILGPTVLGRFFPGFFSMLFPKDVLQQNMLETTAWIGVLYLLLDTGLEINFSAAWKQKGSALIIAVTDIIIPMLIAFVPAFFLPDVYLADTGRRLQFALFMATVMTISAMPISSRVLHDLKLLKTDLGFLTMSALAVNDIIGWALFTIILGLFTQSVFNLSSTMMILLLTVGFSAIALTAGRYLANRTINFFAANKFPEPSSSFTFACIVGIVFGAVTQKIGIHALFGFFIAGVVVGEAEKLRAETRSIISQMVHSLFVPVFFVNIGLKIDFISDFDFFVVVLVTFIGIIGRYLGAWFGATFSRVPKINKALIAIAHTPGGMMEIVVALMALELKLITNRIFIAIVFSAVVSSILMGPWMSFVLKKRKKISLSDFLDFKRGIISVKANTKEEFIREFLDHASLKIKGLSPEKIAEEMLKREAVFSTALGNCIAIPHIRTDNIKDPVLMAGISRNGVDWDSDDGKPVHAVFFLFSPATTNDLHVEILSKIAGAFQKKDTADLVSSVNSDDELRDVIKKLCVT